jgi:hypothetical protein
MVVTIDYVNSFKRALVYNERKVSSGQAALLDAGGFLKEVKDLSMKEKIDRFQMRADMNILAKRHCVHMSLNFSPNDQLTDRKLKAIAATYLKLIGFRYQPYLLYRHEDAGHPHLHLITSNIRSDGTQISLYYKANSVLNPARQKIEKDFRLIRAEGRKLVLTSISSTAANYGKIPTNQAIQNVLNQTLDSYSYTSVQELNAVLISYNVKAYVKHHPEHQDKVLGLWYYILDKEGRWRSAPISSNDLAENARWQYLCQRFEANLINRNKGQARIKNEIDFLLSTQTNTVGQFICQLEEKGIRAVFQRNQIRRVYSLTYVDFQTKYVFDAKVLGPHYSAGYIASCCSLQTAADLDLKAFQKQEQHSAGGDFESVSIALSGSSDRPRDGNAKREADFLFNLFNKVHDYSNNGLVKKKKSRKRRKVS